MTENDRDAETETNMDHNTSKEAGPETLSLTSTPGGTEMECKSFYGDRLHDTNGDRRRDDGNGRVEARPLAPTRGGLACRALWLEVVAGSWLDIV